MIVVRNLGLKKASFHCTWFKTACISDQSGVLFQPVSAFPPQLGMNELLCGQQLTVPSPAARPTPRSQQHPATHQASLAGRDTVANLAANPAANLAANLTAVLQNCGGLVGSGAKPTHKARAGEQLSCYTTRQCCGPAWHVGYTEHNSLQHRHQLANNFKSIFSS